MFEIIENGLTGQITELPDGAVMIKENCQDPFVFVAGQITYKAITAISKLLKDYKFPMLHCPKKYHPLFLEKGWNFHARAKLKYNKNRKNNAPHLPPNSKILKIDNQNIFNQFIWRKEKIELYGSNKNFISNGTGYAFFLDEVLVSEAYASIGSNYAEIGVITGPGNRNKGYAKHVVSHLIENLLSRNISPEWSCNIDNTASLKTALKLGFQIINYDMLLTPDCGNVLCPNLAKWLKKTPIFHVNKGILNAVLEKFCSKV